MRNLGYGDKFEVNGEQKLWCKYDKCKNEEENVVVMRMVMILIVEGKNNEVKGGGI